MIYFRVKPKYDNMYLPKRIIYVGSELFTKKEVEKYNINVKYCEQIEVSSKKTYWFFGARFTNEK